MESLNDILLRDQYTINHYLNFEECQSSVINFLPTEYILIYKNLLSKIKNIINNKILDEKLKKEISDVKDLIQRYGSKKENKKLKYLINKMFT